MADVTEIIQGRADTLEQRSLVKGFISTSRPAPKAFPTTTEIAKAETTNLLWVIVPEHSTEVPYGPCNWAALHGSTLPAQGAACIVALDQNNKPTVMWWEGNETPLLVSALPASPTDGQECYYQSAAMAEAGVVWTLRYRAASASTHKWEFVGGSPLSKAESGGTQRETEASNQVYLNPDAPKITIPLAGDYDFLAKSLTINESGQSFEGLHISNSANGADLCPDTFRLSNQQQGYTTSAQKSFSGVGRGTNISLGVEATVGYAVEFVKAKIRMYGITLEVRPVRVG